jgi:hypothetical protein
MPPYSRQAKPRLWLRHWMALTKPVRAIRATARERKSLMTECRGRQVVYGRRAGGDCGGTGRIGHPVAQRTAVCTLAQCGQSGI